MTRTSASTLTAPGRPAARTAVLALPRRRPDAAALLATLWALALALLLATASAAGAVESPAGDETDPAAAPGQTAEAASDDPAPEPTRRTARSAAARTTVSDEATEIYDGIEGDAIFVEARPPTIPTANTIVAKLPLALALTPASVGVVHQALFDEQRGLILGDALENVSGLNIQTGNGVFDFFVVRGFDSVSSSLILSDGAPEPETTFYQLYNVERVEVLKGPGSFLYGGSPLAGTVNLVRKQPAGTDFGAVGLEGGSFGTFEGTADWNHVLGDDGRWTLRANALVRTSDGYRDGRESDTWAINPALTWRPSESTSLVLNFERVDLDHEPDSGVPLFNRGTEVLPVPRRRSFQSPLDTSSQEIDRLQADFETFLAPNLVLRDKAYWRGLDWLSRNTVLNGVVLESSGRFSIFRSLLTLDDRQELAGNQVELLWSTGRHNLLFGLETSRLSDRFDFGVGLLPSIGVDGDEPFPGLSLGDVFFLPDQARAADATSDVIAPYVIDQIAVGDRFQLLVGARFDRIDFDDDVTGTSRTDEELSPMLGAVYSPTLSLSLYANAGSAFAPPSTFAIEEDRVPEESRQVEVGAKKSFLGGRVQATLALYEIERENIAIPDSTGITRQTGDQESRGVELEVASEISPGLRLFLSGAVTDTELTEFRELGVVGFDPATFQPIFGVLDRSGNEPAFTPDGIVNFWASKRWDGGLGAGLGARWVGEQRIDEDNVFTIDDYVTVDAALFYDLGRYAFSLHLDNLFDEEYLTRGFGAESVIPAPGFGAHVGVDYRF